MNDLYSAVKEAKSELSEIYSLIQKTTPSDSHPTWKKAHEIFEKKAVLFRDFDGILNLFESRYFAAQNLETLQLEVNKLGAAPLSVMISFGHTPMPVHVAVLLSLYSYLASTWSVYDRLSNVLGRLMGDTKVTMNSNPSNNPKLVNQIHYHPMPKIMR